MSDNSSIFGRMIRLLFLLCLACSLSFCSSDTSEQKSLSDTAVKRSELAVLMRQIHTDAKILRKQVISGDTLTISTPSVYEIMVNATPTDAEVTGPVFENFAMQYQLALDSLLQHHDLNISTYNNLVKSCVACHETYCPGPIPTIQKLQVKADLKASGNL